MGATVGILGRGASVAMRGLIAAVALVFILCACAGTAKIGK